MSYLSQPAALASFVQNRPGITGQTGGGATNLDGIVTASGSTPAFPGWRIEINDGSRWRLDLGTGSDVNVANQKVVPADYNPLRPLVWTRYA